ncbi:hypothetical protein [Thermofilum pendens]|uniref:Uncharacterized protein n=1 Tax=Thermofilum pendens (strain DSM 2475 / Hrk 5) TaxID=368408 RepID=A1S118_THEPD|nr:hypothetical protein [Thermofilum pendens]ABL79148.1 hypothetical protein Tpen_1753 [Thermofilum pendens Hrk 5]
MLRMLGYSLIAVSIASLIFVAYATRMGEIPFYLGSVFSGGPSEIVVYGDTALIALEMDVAPPNPVEGFTYRVETSLALFDKAYPGSVLVGQNYVPVILHADYSKPRCAFLDRATHARYRLLVSSPPSPATISNVLKLLERSGAVELQEKNATFPTRVRVIVGGTGFTPKYYAGAVPLKQGGYLVCVVTVKLNSTYVELQNSSTPIRLSLAEAGSKLGLPPDYVEKWLHSIVGHEGSEVVAVYRPTTLQVLRAAVLAAIGALLVVTESRLVGVPPPSPVEAAKALARRLRRILGYARRGGSG